MQRRACYSLISVSPWSRPEDATLLGKYHCFDFEEPRRLRILVIWPVKPMMSSLVSECTVYAAASLL
jgi:hypothetical protein